LRNAAAGCTVTDEVFWIQPCTVDRRAGRHANVIQHMLDSSAITSTPATGASWLSVVEDGQTYLEPHSKELMLRNHV